MEGGELPQYKALLQTFCQRMRLPLPVYKEVGSEGPEHRKLYQMAVTLNRLPFDEVPAEITFESSSPFPTKRMAEEDAAGAALEAIAEYEEKAKGNFKPVPLLTDNFVDSECFGQTKGIPFKREGQRICT